MSQLWMCSLQGSAVSFSSIRSSTETKSSTIVIMIWSFFIPYPTATNLDAPQRSPSISTLRTAASSFAISVSSSHGLTSMRTEDFPLSFFLEEGFDASRSAAAFFSSSVSSPKRSKSSSSSSPAGASTFSVSVAETEAGTDSAAAAWPPIFIGTPLRPKRPVVQTYLFSLLDEDQRSIATGSHERHFGIFTFDGQAKYSVDLGQGSKKLANAQNVEYLSPRWCVVNNNKDLSNVSASALTACANADCTTLSAGGSCFSIGWPANISYAFNSYYQQHDQSAENCDFGGLGLITTVNPSVGDCMFYVTLRTSISTSLDEFNMLLWSILLSSLVSASFLCRPSF